MVECLICNRELAGSNLGLGHLAPRSTQPSFPPGSVNEYQLRLERQRQVRLIPLVDETQGEQVKLCYPLTVFAIPERLRDAACGGLVALYKSTTFTFLPSTRPFNLVGHSLADIDSDLRTVNGTFLV